ncbi:MAG: cysteine desulfurase [Verrucomicrobia bacterium]|nr:cysteine desulfurase [Verrucomicrobiota bacterium]
MLDLRNDFPQLKKPLIYFDSAATALKPQCVIDALCRFYTSEYGTVHRAVYALAAHATALFSASRKAVAQFLNASCEEEIIFTKGTTEALNLLAFCLGEALIQPGDEVLITQVEHHANIVPWQLMCERKGAVLRILPVDDRGEIVLSPFSERTKIVSVAHVSNVLGTVHPISKIAQLAHNVGAVLVVDGAQGAPHLPVDVKALDCDFYTFSGHKAYGPTGVGVLFGKKELLSQLPPYQSGGDMIDKVTFEKTTFASPPYRFEAGTPPIAEVIGLHAAIDYLASLDLTKVQAHEEALLAYATEQLQLLPGVTIYGQAPNKGAILSFNVEGVHPLDLGTFLDLQGVAVRTGHLCAQPTMARFGVEQMVRASFAIYNTLEEVDQWIAALKKAVNRLR